MKTHAVDGWSVDNNLRFPQSSSPLLPTMALSLSAAQFFFLLFNRKLCILNNLRSGEFCVVRAYFTFFLRQ